MTAVAPTLPYDWAALGEHNTRGEPLRQAEWAGVTVPVLVVHGSKSSHQLQAGSRALADALPNAELRELAGASHNVPMQKLAPLLAGFFTADRATNTARRSHVATEPRRQHA